MDREGAIKKLSKHNTSSIQGLRVSPRQVCLTEQPFQLLSLFTYGGNSHSGLIIIQHGTTLLQGFSKVQCTMDNIKSMDPQVVMQFFCHLPPFEVLESRFCIATKGNNKLDKNSQTSFRQD